MQKIKSTRRTGSKAVAFICASMLAAMVAVALGGCNNPIAVGVKALQVEALSYKSIPNAPATPNIATVDGPAGSGKVLVTWNAVQGALSYDVYYSATVSPPALPNGGTNISIRSCTISSLTNWTNYYFWVIAKNSVGSSALSIPPAIGASGIKVTSISLNKPSATLLVGSSEALTVTYTPSTASIPNVIWGTSNASIASVSSGTITGGNTTGSATITVTAADGNGATTTFTATTKAFVANTAGPAGGYLFYDSLSYGTKGWRYMEAASVNGSGSLYWWNGSSIVIPGAYGTDFGTGKSNSDAIIAAQGAGAYMASDCRNYTQGGYSDWFMPSETEANQMISIVSSINITSLWGLASSSQYNNGSGNGCWTYRQATTSPYAWGWIATLTSFGGYSTYITRPIRQF